MQAPSVCAARAGHTAAWVVFCVSQAPDVEARIVEELASLDLLATRARPAPRPIQWEDTGKLAYLNNVIKVPPPPQEPQSLGGEHVHFRRKRLLTESCTRRARHSVGITGEGRDAHQSCAPWRGSHRQGCGLPSLRRGRAATA